MTIMRFLIFGIILTGVIYSNFVRFSTDDYLRLTAMGDWPTNERLQRNATQENEMLRRQISQLQHTLQATLETNQKQLQEALESNAKSLQTAVETRTKVLEEKLNKLLPPTPAPTPAVIRSFNPIRLPQKNSRALPSFGACPALVFKTHLKKACVYLRTKAELDAQRPKKTCSGTLDVLAWLTDEINAKNLTMFVAYGELIHMLREKEFVNPDGSYMDDDVDMWALASTFRHLVKLEPQLWEKFGWTIRTFQNCQEVTMFAQIVSTCGHRFDKVPSKAKSDHPAIELYMLQENRSHYKDTWEGPSYPARALFPQRRIPFRTKGTTKEMNLQIPLEAESILECLYGNWKVPSEEHVRGTSKAKQDCLSAIGDPQPIIDADD